jgi:hypothetical protein
MNSVVSNFEMGVGGWLGILAGLYTLTKDFGRYRNAIVIASPFVGSFLYWGAVTLVRQSIFFGLSTLQSLLRFDAIACFLVVLFLNGTVVPTVLTIRQWTAPPAPPSPPPSEPPSEPSSTDTSTQESDESDSESDSKSDSKSDESSIPSRRASNVSDRIRVINEDGSDSPLSFEKVGSDDESAVASKKKN